MTIKIEGLSMSYVAPAESRNSLKSTAVALIKREKLLERRIAVDDLSISISKGEILGVVGRNGAGKSTLLKLIAGILPPTSGRVRTSGSIAALVELGAGFHPELTAYENIIVYGRLLGRSIEELKKSADSILSWADLTERRDDPVRTFSSGMMARLGFAIATDKQPEILLVDEVLAVGDRDFQVRSSERMSSLMKSGTTVVLVSHDLNVIGNLCHRTLWLEKGRAKMLGKSEDVLPIYLKTFTE
jgi:ABC-type polysaccharide/polyol phosphate transport system ATPase subunit